MKNISRTFETDQIIGEDIEKEKFDRGQTIKHLFVEILKEEVKAIKKSPARDSDVYELTRAYRLIDKYVYSIFFYRGVASAITYSISVADIFYSEEQQNEMFKEIFNTVNSPIVAKIITDNFLDTKQKEKNLELIKKNKELEKEAKKQRQLLKKAEGKKGTFRKSGHLIDQMLRYSYPKNEGNQLSIFDSLKDSTKKTIETVVGVEVKQIVEGIRLSNTESKIIDSLCKLLHESSQNLDPTKSNYYTGNLESGLLEYGGDINTPAPKLSFTLYELTKEYKGGDYVGGKDIDNVKQILKGLDKKPFLLSYVETTINKDGGKTERKIEEFQKLINILKISETEISKDNVELSKKEDTIIVLNPIFRRQINSKFIVIPNDLNRQTMIAYGSHNISEITIRLRDYLMRELSSKRYKADITIEKLFWTLADGWMKESRKKLVKGYTDKAIETVIAMGLLLSYEIEQTTTGEQKYVFHLNKSWK